MSEGSKKLEPFFYIRLLSKSVILNFTYIKKPGYRPTPVRHNVEAGSTYRPCLGRPGGGRGPDLRSQKIY